MFLLLAIQWLQARVLFLSMLFGNLIPLSWDAPLPCDFCHVPLLNILVVPSHDAPLAHAS